MQYTVQKQCEQREKYPFPPWPYILLDRDKQ